MDNVVQAQCDSLPLDCDQPSLVGRGQTLAEVLDQLINVETVRRRSPRMPGQAIKRGCGQMHGVVVKGYLSLKEHAWLGHSLGRLYCWLWRIQFCYCCCRCSYICSLQMVVECHCRCKE